LELEAMAGETYFFMVGAFSSGPAGQLVFSVDIHNGIEEQDQIERQDQVGGIRKGISK
jgi:hypothetical protein